MRAVITEFTISNAAYFNALCYPDSVQDHVRRMKKPFEWGTHVEITALAAILSLPIFVAIKKNKHEYYWAKYGARKDERWVHPVRLVLSNTFSHIEICNENYHYDVILTADGSLPSTSPPAAIVPSDDTTAIIV